MARKFFSHHKQTGTDRQRACMNPSSGAVEAHTFQLTVRNLETYSTPRLLTDHRQAPLPGETQPTVISDFSPHTPTVRLTSSGTPTTGDTDKHLHCVCREVYVHSSEYSHTSAVGTSCGVRYERAAVRYERARFRTSTAPLPDVRTRYRGTCARYQGSLSQFKTGSQWSAWLPGSQWTQTLPRVYAVHRL
ncbi:hypothetical protein Bbelb_105220 [Branchiostoma belcheri]|nr:hypothetical protein Bbelb_105220 [Branchiostoma belcheri]